MATGLFLIFAEPFRTGSLCRVRDLVGFIERVSLARTIMLRRDGCRIFIPNGIFADTHQTSGNARELRYHELLLRLHPATPADTIQQFIDDLRATLPKFAVAPVVDALQDHLPPLRGLSTASDSVMTPPYAGTPQASSFTNNTNGLSSFRSSLDSRNVPAWDDDASNQAVSVELHDMYVVKVSVQIDRDQFPTFEAAKTEVSKRTGRFASIIAGVASLVANVMDVRHVFLTLRPAHRSTWRSSRTSSGCAWTCGSSPALTDNVYKPQPPYLYQFKTRRLLT